MYAYAPRVRHTCAHVRVCTSSMRAHARVRVVCACSVCPAPVVGCRHGWAAHPHPPLVYVRVGGRALWTLGRLAQEPQSCFATSWQGGIVGGLGGKYVGGAETADELFMLFDPLAQCAGCNVLEFDESGKGERATPPGRTRAQRVGKGTAGDWYMVQTTLQLALANGCDTRNLLLLALLDIDCWSNEWVWTGAITAVDRIGQEGRDALHTKLLLCINYNEPVQFDHWQTKALVYQLAGSHKNQTHVSHSAKETSQI